MKKVYVCYSIPDYIGINIEGIFFKEEDAKKFCEEWNKNHASYDYYDYEEHEVK